MAGIGWKLQRMIDRGSLAGTDRRLPDRRGGDVGAVAADDRRADQPARGGPPRGGDFAVVERLLTSSTR